jgi:trimethylamine--corrinoid protein Co-methyltransferase
MQKGFIRNYRPLELLTEEQVAALHRAVLDVLRETGLTFHSERALKDLAGYGCQVDYDIMRVRFPEYLVEEAIRRCPSSYRVRARDPKDDIILGGDTVHFMSFPGMQTVDLETWEPKDPTARDYEDMVRVLDALPNLHTMGPYPYFGYENVPSVMRVLEGAALEIRGSTKLRLPPPPNDCDQFHIEMMRATGGECFLPVDASAPLEWADNQIRAAYRAVEAGFPMSIVQATIMGGSGPATIAGTAVHDLASELSMVVLVQMLRPGMRVHLGSFTLPMNMRRGAPGFGRISRSLVKAVESQMLRHYGIPARDTEVGLVNAKKPDFQTGYEKALNALASALTGANLLFMHSGLYGEMTAHPLQAVLDDDVAGMVGRFLEGVTVNDETIALELIESVGPIPGNYLNTAHTRKWWPLEQSIPRAADDLTYPEWLQSGKKDCLDYARGVMEEILAGHRVSRPLTPGQEAEIGEILRKAREYYRKRGLILDEEWRLYEEKVLKSPDYPFV